MILLCKKKGKKQFQLNLAEQAISAKEAIAKKSSVVMLSDDKTGAANVVAEAMTIINSINTTGRATNNSGVS